VAESEISQGGHHLLVASQVRRQQPGAEEAPINTAASDEKSSKATPRLQRQLPVMILLAAGHDIETYTKINAIAGTSRNQKG
jgi:hypothetical protein